jgi:hypothetical protein
VAATLATQNCQLVAKRNDLELQFRAVANQPASHERRAELNAIESWTILWYKAT